MRYMVFFENLETAWVKCFYTLPKAYAVYDRMKSGYPTHTHVHLYDAVSEKTIAEYRA